MSVDAKSRTDLEAKLIAAGRSALRALAASSQPTTCPHCGNGGVVDVAAAALRVEAKRQLRLALNGVDIPEATDAMPRSLRQARLFVLALVADTEEAILEKVSCQTERGWPEWAVMLAGGAFCGTLGVLYRADGVEVAEDMLRGMLRGFHHTLALHTPELAIALTEFRFGEH